MYSTKKSQKRKEDGDRSQAVSAMEFILSF